MLLYGKVCHLVKSLFYIHGRKASKNGLAQFSFFCFLLLLLLLQFVSNGKSFVNCFHLFLRYQSGFCFTSTFECRQYLTLFRIRIEKRVKSDSETQSGKSVYFWQLKKDSVTQHVPRKIRSARQIHSNQTRVLLCIVDLLYFVAFSCKLKSKNTGGKAEECDKSYQYEYQEIFVDCFVSNIKMVSNVKEVFISTSFLTSPVCERSDIPLHSFYYPHLN